MYALSIVQPWASLIVIGAKTIETRAWHGGLYTRACRDLPGQPLAIHAMARPDYHAWRDVLDAGGPDIRLRYGLRKSTIPRGCLLGHCRVDVFVEIPMFVGACGRTMLNRIADGVKPAFKPCCGLGGQSP